MRQPYEIREKFGSVFVTAFQEDDLIVPWKPLSIGEYIKYQFDINRGLIPSWRIEEEIFTKCVQDQSLVRQMPFLKAGIISVVVQNIFQYSGQVDIDGYNNDLNVVRAILNADGSKIFHESVQLICMAFPYKPEEVYAMDYETFMTRTIQAESKLIQMGVLKAPLKLELPQEPKEARSKLKQPQQKPQRIDAKKLWETQRQKDSPSTTPVEKTPPRPSNDVPGGKQEKIVSPILQNPGKPHHGINFNLEQKELDTYALTGHEKADLHIERAKMVEDTALIYADVIKELASRKNKK